MRQYAISSKATRVGRSCSPYRTETPLELARIGHDLRGGRLSQRLRATQINQYDDRADQGIGTNHLQSVDRDLYDAAKVDGASRWHQFHHVTIPGIRPTLVFVVLMTIIWSLLVFDYIYIITQGGPAGATEVVSTLMYKEAFARFEAGYAAALGDRRSR